MLTAQWTFFMHHFFVKDSSFTRLSRFITSLIHLLDSCLYSCQTHKMKAF